MKRIWILIVAMLWIAQAANALIVSTDEYGEVTEEGLEITIDEAETDLLTGLPLMELKGSISSNGPVSVTIIRSQSGLEDQFCCADNCTNGNGGTSEDLQFTINGFAEWFVHYYPEVNTNVTVTYTFSDGSESRTLIVHYVYDTQAIEQISEEKGQAIKVLRDGLLYIIKNNKIYHL